MATCDDRQCERPARMAIKTARPTRAKMTSTIHWDDRTAPEKGYMRYCKEHGKALLASLADVLIDIDD